MSDRIFVKGLALHAYHGVMPHEAKVGQTFLLDLDLEIDLTAAARSDKVVDTVSYDKVVDCATECLLRRATPPHRGGSRSRRRCRTGGFSARALGADHDPQAARADRRDVRRYRCHAGAKPPWLKRCWPSAEMSETAGPFSTVPSPCSATARTCG